MGVKEELLYHYQLTELSGCYYEVLYLAMTQVSILIKPLAIRTPSY